MPNVYRPLEARAHAVLVAMLVLAAVVGYAASGLNFTTPVLLLVATGLVASLPVGFRLVMNQFDPFEPTFVFALVWIAMFVVRPAAMLAQHNFLWPQAGADIDVQPTFNRTLLLGLLGAVGFVLGYASPVGRRVAARVRPARPQVDETRLLVVAGVSCAIGFAMFGAFVLYVGGIGPTLHVLATGRSAALTHVFQSTPKYLYFGISLLAPAVLILLALGFSTKRPLLGVAAVIALVPYLVFAYPTGNRTILLPLFGGIVFYFYLARDRRPSLPTIVGLLVIALFASAYLSGVRRTSATGFASTEQTTAQQLVTHPVDILQPVTSGADASEFEALSGALLVVPSRMHFEYGKALLTDLFTRPIPRALWHGKPPPPRDQVIRSLFPTQYSAGGNAVNPEFSALLIFYLDFGAVGCVLGMFCYGILMRMMYTYFVHNKQILAARLLLAIGAPLLVEALRDSPVDALSHYVVFLGPVLLAFYVPRRLRESYAGRLSSDRHQAGSRVATFVPRANG